MTVAGPHVQVLASYAGEEADEWELDGMAAITRNTYGEGEAYFLGCDLGVSDLTRFVGGWLAAQPQDGRQPEANLRSPASGVTSDVLHTVRQSDDAIFDFYLTRGRSDVELRDIAGEPIVLFRAERGSDGGAYTVHRNGVFVTKGAADVFLETERKDFRMFSLEERERAVELYFTTPMTTAQVVEHLGYPTRQCLERWLAMDSRYAGHMAKPIIPLETRRRAVELVLGGMQQKQAAKQLGVSVGAVHGWVRAYRKGGMAALQPKNRNSAQGNKPAGSRRRPSAADDDDAEALRRRVEELELENALMREVVEVVKKDPGADLRRLSNREKTLLIDRLRPAYSLSSMTCLLAIAPSSYHYHHARLGVDKYAGLRAEVAGAFADSKGRYGYRRIKAVLKTGVSEKVVRRIMAEEGLVAHVPKRRRYSSYEGETTPAPANLVDRDFTAERPNEKWLTDISEIKARDGKVYLSPMIDCFDGKIVAYTAGFSPNAELANRMLEKAASTLPGNARPLVHSDRGCHYRWPGWLGLMERFGLTRSMSAKGCSPDNAAAEGFFGRMKTEAVYPEKWEEHTRNEVLALVDEYIRWYNHERIKQSLGWMSPVQYRQSQGMAA